MCDDGQTPWKARLAYPTYGVLGFDFAIASGPFEGPAIVIPPALPGGYLLWASVPLGLILT